MNKRYRWEITDSYLTETHYRQEGGAYSARVLYLRSRSLTDGSRSSWNYRYAKDRLHKIPRRPYRVSYVCKGNLCDARITAASTRRVWRVNR